MIGSATVVGLATVVVLVAVAVRYLRSTRMFCVVAVEGLLWKQPLVACCLSGRTSASICCARDSHSGWTRIDPGIPGDPRTGIRSCCLHCHRKRPSGSLNRPAKKSVGASVPPSISSFDRCLLL